MTTRRAARWGGLVLLALLLAASGAAAQEAHDEEHGVDAGLAERLHELEAALEKESARALRAEGRATTAEEEVTRLQGESTAVTSQLQKAAADAKAEAKEHKSANAALEDKVRQLEAKIKDKDSELQQAKKDASGTSALQSQMDKLKADKADLQKQVDKLKADKADLQKQLTAAEAEKANLAQKVSSLEEKVRGLQGKLSGINEKSESRVRELEDALASKYTPVALMEDLKAGLSELGSFTWSNSLHYSHLAYIHAKPHAIAAKEKAAELASQAVDAAKPIYDEKVRPHVEPVYVAHVSPTVSLISEKSGAFWEAQGKPALQQGWELAREYAALGWAKTLEQYDLHRTALVAKLNEQPSAREQGEGLISFVELLLALTAFLVLYKPTLWLAWWALTLPVRILLAPFCGGRRCQAAEKPKAAPAKPGAAAAKPPRR